MNKITQEQFLNDTKSQIMQYLYRALQNPTCGVVQVIQSASGNGNLNWHNSSNNSGVAAIFTALATSTSNYTLADGDFQTYLLLQLVNIIYYQYEQELFSQFLQHGYNISPESVVGSLSDAYSTQLPQNTNFPGISNTANEYVPIPPTERLIPSSLYTDTDSD